MNQPSLFDAPLSSGIELRDAGIKKVLDNNPGFTELIEQQAWQIYQEKGSVTSDDLRQWGDKNNIHPTHCNGWGAVTRALGWRKIDRTPSRIPSNHGREIGVYVPKSNKLEPIQER